MNHRDRGYPLPFGGMLIQFPRAAFSVAIILCLIVLFQNCGQSHKGPTNPLDDIVSKIDSGVDGSDDEIVISGIELAAAEELGISGTLGDELIPAPSDDLLAKLKECRRIVGEERLDCIEEALDLYYALLETQAGYTVLRSEHCLFAFKKTESPGMTVLFDSTCRYDSNLFGLISLHLDECLLVPSSINPRMTTESAWLPFRRGRHFQRLRDRANYIESGTKQIGIFGATINGADVRDACGTVIRAQDLGINTSLDVP